MTIVFGFENIPKLQSIHLKFVIFLIIWSMYWKLIKQYFFLLLLLFFYLVNLQVPSDKSLILLTFEHLKTEYLNIWTFEHLNIGKFEHLEIWKFEHFNIWTSKHWNIGTFEHSITILWNQLRALILFKRLRVTLVTSIASMDWVKIQKVVRYIIDHHHYKSSCRS